MAESSRYRKSPSRGESYDSGERVLRMAPLYLALMIVMAVPVILLGLSDEASAVPADTVRPDGAWSPSVVRKELSSSPERRHRQWHPPPQAQLQTPEARCELYQLNEKNEQVLVLEPTYSKVMVALVDDADMWLLQQLDLESADTFSSHSGGNSMDAKLWMPLVATFNLENLELSPWQVAKRAVDTALEISTVDDEAESASRMDRVLYDSIGLPDGRVPTNEQSSWTFLGRHQTMARHGGGFTYCYLHHRSMKSLVTEAATKTNKALVRVSEALIQEGLTLGHFADITGLATVSLALHHTSRKE